MPPTGDGWRRGLRTPGPPWRRRRDYVYHPDLHGSFSLKDILHPLVPHLTYDEASFLADGFNAGTARASGVQSRDPGLKPGVRSTVVRYGYRRRQARTV